MNFAKSDVPAVVAIGKFLRVGIVILDDGSDRAADKKYGDTGH